MGSVAYFSEGAGLPWVIIGVLAVLTGLGAVVRFSRLRAYLGNIMIPASLVVLSLVFWFFSYEFPQETAGPADIPRLYLILILVLSGVLLFQAIRGKEKSVPRLERKRFLALLIAILIAYFLLMPVIGYFLSTFVFIVIMLHLLGYGKKGLIWVIAGGWIVFSYFLFYKLLYIQLPLGLFEGLF